MKKCTNCGHTQEDGKFCGKCGSPIDPNTGICPKCNFQNTVEKQDQTEVKKVNTKMPKTEKKVLTPEEKAKKKEDKSKKQAFKKMITPVAVQEEQIDQKELEEVRKRYKEWTEGDKS